MLDLVHIGTKDKEWALRIYEDDPNHGAATRRIRWCINEAVLKHASSAGALRLFVIIGVKPARGREVRHVVPLSLGEQLVQLRSGGAHTIHARLVALSDTSDPDFLYNQCLSRNSHGFIWGIWDRLEDGSLRINAFGHPMPFETAAKYDCVVAEDQFATRPEWQKTIVNAWFPRSPADECNWRRRVFASAFLYAFVSPLAFVCGVLIAGYNGGLLARRGVNWRQLHPITGSLPYLTHGAGDVGSLLTHDAEGGLRWWGYKGLFFTPLLQLIFASVGFLVGKNYIEPNGFASGINAFLLGYVSVPATLLASYLFLFLIAVLLAGVGWAKEFISKALSEASLKRYEQEKHKSRDEAVERNARAEQMYANFVCLNGSGRAAEPSFSDNRSAYVRKRLNDVKLAVCRPFAE